MKGYKKLLLVWILRFLTKIFCLVPLKNRVVFSSFAGNSYCDNLRCISDYLREHYADQFEIVWQFKHPERFSYLEKEGIRVIKYFSLKDIFYCCTSKVLIDDHGPHSYFKRRKGQMIINTGHGGNAYKKIGFDEKNDRRYDLDLLLKYTFDNISLFCSTSRHSSETAIKRGFRYKGEILECGTPRNDIFFEEIPGLEARIRKELYLPDGKKILLYAPTYRYEAEDLQYQLDFTSLLHCLNQRFGGEWVILMRFHPSTQYVAPENTIDVSAYPEMQYLLYISDILLTDYSSCMWDMSMTKKPIFLYAPDIDDYDKERGFYIDMNQLPFPLCKTQDALEKAILDFEIAPYQEAVEKYHEAMGNFETGHATETVCRRICQACEIKDGEKV